ncbi:DNA-binding transcriptional LysR family regulator [Ectopseudomonas oleovorans]|uniref:DNA-binding transcriptional LysR family regulator n=2 Tax=Pseudomonadaceae TaxID=135621 RepID=A0A397MFB2_ECTOL|nr:MULTISPECIES: LysR family transcriptional regulator [Pseudomonas]QMV64773.1 LysR family transcriptional regulator [Pseudomonas berkeleyensis]RIA22213.1 DNA-binding transcriptional LysR family regulator [Pseudomonas oleovorans]WSO40242.1 LysR substrate-binding domain-containing protein [Pseudomonas berkeleyensis]
MHRIEFLDLAAFVRVAESHSFLEAAQSLHLSQPALSRRLQKLEETLGAKLLERTTRRSWLTDVGKDYLPRARRMLEDYESSVQGVRELKTHQKGTVTIACIPTAAFYFLPSVIRVFNEAYPGIRIRILDVSANEGLERVISGDADFGINMISAQHPEISFTPLLRDPFVLAMRSDHPLAALPVVEWQDLQSVRLITVSRDSGNRMLLDSALSGHGIRLNGFYEVQHLSTSLGLVECGLGVAILPRLAMPASEHDAICCRELPPPQIERTIGLVRRDGAPLSSTAELFIEMLLKRWRE